MTRTTTATAILLFVVVTSGCSTGVQHRSESVGGEGEISAQVVSEPPANATVVEFDESLRDESEYLGRAVRQAANATEAVVTVPETEVDATKERLHKLPLYTISEADSGEWGYYLRYRNETVRVRFVVLD